MAAAVISSGMVIFTREETAVRPLRRRPDGPSPCPTRVASIGGAEATSPSARDLSWVANCNTEYYHNQSVPPGVVGPTFESSAEGLLDDESRRTEAQRAELKELASIIKKERN